MFEWGSRLVAPVLLAALAALPACSDYQPQREVLTGTVEGSDALVGVVIFDGRVAFYTCGGPNHVAEHTVMLYGPVRSDGERTTLALEHEGFELAGRVDEAGGAGTLVTPDGETLRWTVVGHSADDEMAGVYHRQGEGCQTAAIVGRDRDGAPYWIRGAWCDGEVKPIQQVTPVMPIVVGDSGLEVEIAPGGVPRRVFLTPVFEE